MEFAFYFAAGIAAISTLRVISHTNAVHALLYLIVSLLAVSMCFFALGAPFAGALEIIVYAGAISRTARSSFAIRSDIAWWTASTLALTPM